MQGKAASPRRLEMLGSAACAVHGDSGNKLTFGNDRRTDMKKLIFIFIFSLLLITPCSAAPYDEASLQDSLPDYARNLAGEATQPARRGT